MCLIAQVPEMLHTVSYGTTARAPWRSSHCLRFPPAQPRGGAELAVLLVLCLVFGTTAHFFHLFRYLLPTPSPSSSLSSCSFISLLHFLPLYLITSSIPPLLSSSPSPRISSSGTGD
ncbi:hypothetical protein BJX96DRAFT_48331 [Aspergillus floccosus]